MINLKSREEQFGKFYFLCQILEAPKVIYGCSMVF